MTSNESEKTKLCYQNDLKRITKDNSHGITSKSGDFEIDQENRENIDPLLMKVSPPKIQNKPDANDISPYRSRKRKRDEVDTDDEDDIVGPGWELLDPTPNVHDLFETFNRRFFKSKLVNVQVRWHKDDPTRTASCRNYSDGTIKIALNENLLSLRTRRDLVEVLLHEMIHAYAFLHGIFELDDEGHGPFFMNMMKQINKESGANIQVYHKFFDEIHYCIEMDSLEKEAKADMRNKKVVDSEKLVSHDASKKVTQDSTVSNISGTNDTTKPLNIHDGQTAKVAVTITDWEKSDDDVPVQNPNTKPIIDAVVGDKNEVNEGKEKEELISCRKTPTKHSKEECSSTAKTEPHTRTNEEVI